MIVYSFGQNGYGELGHGDEIEKYVPNLINCFVGKEILDVACGNEHSLVLTGDGKVFACGFNASGQCGSNVFVGSSSFICCDLDQRVARVFSGNGSEHSAIISEFGQLYTFGYNSRGQLGQSTTKEFPRPTLVRGLEKKKVLYVACSYYHTLVTTREQEVYGFGRNDFGQIGSDDLVDKVAPFRIKYFDGLPVYSIACGQYHSVVSLGRGMVSFGRNDDGLLGIPFELDVVSVPTKVASPLDEETVVSLACGYYHTVAVTNSGSVYVFGKNEYGQLGLGHQQPVHKPTLVEALSHLKIAQVACGSYHTLVRSECGKVFPFGRNNHGQLGIGNTIDSYLPQSIPILRGLVVQKVAAGFYHSMCVVKGSADISFVGESTLSMDLLRLLRESIQTDLTFIVEGVSIQCHKCIICARCDVLERMIDWSMKESGESVIIVPGYSRRVFCGFLEYLYSDKVEELCSRSIDLDFVLELRILADQYLVTRLSRMCEIIIHQNITVENVSVLLQSLRVREWNELYKEVVHFILNNFHAVIHDENVLKLPQELLDEILQYASAAGLNTTDLHIHLAPKEAKEALHFISH